MDTASLYPVFYFSFWGFWKEVYDKAVVFQVLKFELSGKEG